MTIRDGRDYLPALAQKAILEEAQAERERNGEGLRHAMVSVKEAVEAAVRLGIVVPAATIAEQAAEIARLRNLNLDRDDAVACLHEEREKVIKLAGVRDDLLAKIAAVEALRDEWCAIRLGEYTGMGEAAGWVRKCGQDLRAALAATSKETT